MKHKYNLNSFTKKMATQAGVVKVYHALIILLMTVFSLIGEQSLAQPLVSFDSIKLNPDISCHGFTDGIADVYVSPSAGTYDYSINGGPLVIGAITGGVGSIGGFAPGTYTITVTDGSISFNKTITFTDPPALTIAFTMNQLPGCAGELGTLSADINGGTLISVPYHTELTNSANVLMNPFPNIYLTTFSGLDKDVYTLKVEDEVGCTYSQSIALPDLCLFHDQEISCTGYGDGKIQASTTTPPTVPNSWSYTLNGPTGTFTNTSGLFTMLIPGTYTVCMNDGVNTFCNTTSFIDPDPLVASFSVDSTVSCLGNDGALTINISGGTLINQPYLVTWSSGTNPSDVFDQSVTALVAGTYTVGIEDEVGCTLDKSIVLGPTPAMVITPSFSPIACAGGNTSVSASAINGVAPFTFTVAGVPLPTNLAAGTYTIVGTDAKGCTGTLQFTITEPAGVNFTFTVDSVSGCSGTDFGGLSASITGGTGPYGTEWRNSSNVLLNPSPNNFDTFIGGLTTGTYSLTVTDASGCSLTKSAYLPNLCLFKDQDVSCFGFNDGFIVVSTTSVGGPWTFSRDGGLFPNLTGQFPGLVPGLHTFCATNGVLTFCDTMSIYQPMPLVIDSFHIDSTVSCLGNDGAMTVFVSGGTQDNQPYLLTWSSGTVSDIYDNSVTGLSVGTYTVDIEDDNGCLLSGSFGVTGTPPMVVSATYMPIPCNGSTTMVSASATNAVNPVTFTANGTPLPAALSANTYTIIATDVKGCTGSTVVTITQPALIASTIFVTICDSYLWETPTSIQTYENSGLYTATYQAANNCDSVVTLNLTILKSTNASYTVCAANQYTWPANGVSYTVAGTYLHTLVGGNSVGCDSNLTLHLTLLPMTLFKDQDVSCFGFNDGRVFATVNAPGTWTISRDGGLFPITTSGPAAEFQNLTPGVHTICATNGGCSYCDTITIYEPLPLVIDSFHVDSTVSCLGNDGAMTVFVSGGTQDNQPYLINWSAGTVDDIYDKSVIGLIVGTHTVNIEDDRGCLLSGSFAVGQTPAIVVTPTIGSIICNGGQANVSASATGGLAPFVFTIGATTLPANFGAGTYTIVATDVKGCTGEVSINIAQPSPIVTTVPFVACDSYTWSSPNGNGNTYTMSGSYTHTLAASNGCDSVVTLNLTIKQSSTSSTSVCAANQYTWAVNAVTYTASGTYTYTIPLGNSVGCDSTLTLNLNLLPMTLFKDQDVSCFGFNDGRVFATVNVPGTWTISRDGGLFPITTSGPAAEFQNLTPGVHTICATNGGCNYCDTITIYEPLPLVIDSFHVDSTVSCLNNDGAMTVFVSGGTQDNQPYLINWSAGTVDDIYDKSVIGLTVGTYTVNIEDDRGCLLSGSYAVGQTPAPIITAIYTPIPCAGGTTSVDASSVNGVAPFVHTIGATTLPAVFSAGTYTIVSTDVKGCTGSTVITITQPIVAVINSTEIKCDTYTWAAPGNGNTYTNSGIFTHTLLKTNGCDSVILSLNLTINNSSSSTQTVYAANHYTWAVNGTTYTNSGIYTVTFLGTNAAGCDSLIKLDLNLISMPIVKNQDVSCFGNNDGFVTVSTTAPGAWTYTRDGGLFPNMLGEFPGLTPGIHTICGSDGINTYCDTITIYEPSPLTAYFTIDSTVSCLLNDGALTININGGTAENQPYLTYWSTGVTPASIYSTSVTGLAAGTYTVTIEDDNGCFLTKDTILGLSPAIVVNATLGTIPCSGGNATINATATSGLAPYTFAIGVTALPANFIAGTYTITATDVKGCTGTQVITLTQPPIFTNTESITRCVSYTWPVNSQTYTVSGNYTETFVTAAGCDSAQTLILTINQPTSSTTTVTAANSYLWPASGLTYTNSGTFTTTLVGQNANGCDSNLTLILNILNMNLAVNQHVSCNGNNDGSVNAFPTGGSGNFEFNVDGGAYAAYFGNVVTGLAPGTHTICAKEIPSNVVICDTITITQPALLSVVLTVDSTVSCLGNDGKLTATITGGTAILQPYLTTWASGVVTNSIYQTTVNGLNTGTYTVTVEDDNLCFATATVVLGLTPAVVVTATNTPIICNGGSSVISFNASGGTGSLSTTISGGTYTVTAGTYTLTATDAKGCTGTTVVSVTQPSLLLFYDTLVRCNSYLWPVNGVTYTNSGNYTSTYTSVNGCDSNYYLNLTINYSSSSVENVTAANSYTWLANGVTYTNAGTYLHTLTNAAGCDSNLTLNLSILNFTVTLNQHVSCFGANNGSADGIATGGTGNFEYSVDGGAYASNPTGFFPGLAPGTHTICAKELPSNVVMCDTVTITEPAQLSVVLTVDSTVSCLGNDGALTATITGGTAILQPYLTTWSAGVSPASIYSTYVTGLATGTYTVTVEDDRLCFATATVVLGPTPAIVVNASYPPITCFGGSTLITPTSTGGTGAKTYTISGGTFNVPTGSYTITATDVKGCTGSLVYTVTQPALITTLQTVDSCNTYTWPANNTTYTASGVFVTSFVTPAGCDSVVTLNLTIRNASSSVENVVAANSYTWLANGVTYTLSNTYTHTLTNAVGCDSNLTLVLSIVNMNLAVNQHISCNGINDGSVNATLTGGSGNFEFSVDGGSYAPYFGNVVTGLSAATHTICAKEIPSNVVICDTITITQPSALNVVLTVDSTVSCLGNDGAITATITGGTAILQPYLTVWSAGVTPASIYSTYVTGLATGTYTVTVEDDHACFATATVTVGSTPSITVTAVQQQVACFGGTSLVTPSSTGGTGAKTYSITGGTFNAPAGSYTITATDTKGCTGTVAITVTTPALLTSTETVFASSSYTWTNGTTYTLAGTYVHTFTSQFACDSIATLILNFAGVCVSPKVFLGGAYVPADGKMHDLLRQQGLLSTGVEPYTTAPYNKPTILDANPAEKVVSAAILARTGDSAVVDWVFVELRNATNPGTIVATKRALLLRNGAVVSSVDGASALFFPQNIPGNYYVSIKHRNHLGVMSLTALPLSTITTGVDFTTLAPVYVHSAIPAITNAPRKTIGSVSVLWPGDANANKNVRYNGVLNDKQEILNAVAPNPNSTTFGYRIEDVNMDGIVRYNNTDNDKNFILNFTIGVLTPGAVYNQHTPN